MDPEVRPPRRSQPGAEHTYEAGTHAPLLIYPNPLNPAKYVVLNSGFTFREYAYLNNARQVRHDYLPQDPSWVDASGLADVTLLQTVGSPPDRSFTC